MFRNVLQHVLQNVSRNLHQHVLQHVLLNLFTTCFGTLHAVGSTPSKYESFWREYGKALKMGIIEDSGNRGRLSKLLRFHSSKSGDGLVSLEEYVQNMKEGQKSVYYLTGALLCRQQFQSLTF